MREEAWVLKSEKQELVGDQSHVREPLKLSLKAGAKSQSEKRQENRKSGKDGPCKKPITSPSVVQ